MTEAAAAPKTSTKRRVYVVLAYGTDPRLVRASNVAQAVGYAARKTFKAALATQDDLLDMAGKVAVEDAVETTE